MITMPTFQYEAMDHTGREIKDSIDAATQEEAKQLIRQKGFFLTQIAGNSKRATNRGIASVERRARWYRTLSVLLLCRMGNALAAGASLLRSTGPQFIRAFSARVKRQGRKEHEGSTIQLGQTSGSTGVTQTYQGFVEAVHDGMAHLTLETTSGHHFELEWDAAELAAKSIEERQPFILQTLTSGDTMRFQFNPDRLHPISSKLVQEIDDMTAHYRATGELDADDE
jgi:hypothetical protein